MNEPTNLHDALRNIEVAHEAEMTALCEKVKQLETKRDEAINLLREVYRLISDNPDPIVQEIEKLDALSEQLAR